jgi:hypothetical protein
VLQNFTINVVDILVIDFYAGLYAGVSKFFIIGGTS